MNKCKCQFIFKNGYFVCENCGICSDRRLLIPEITKEFTYPMDKRSLPFLTRRWNNPMTIDLKLKQIFELIISKKQLYLFKNDVPEMIKFAKGLRNQKGHPLFHTCAAVLYYFARMKNYPLLLNDLNDFADKSIIYHFIKFHKLKLNRPNLNRLTQRFYSEICLSEKITYSETCLTDIINLVESPNHRSKDPVIKIGVSLYTELKKKYKINQESIAKIVPISCKTLSQNRI